MASQNVTGFFIITLPPEDNPSKGKTITAFAISDPPSNTPSSVQEQLQYEEEQIHQQLQHTQSPTSESLHPNTTTSSFNTIFSRPIRLLSLLGASLLVILLLQSLLSETHFELTQDNPDESKQEVTSLLFDLYPKWSTGYLSDVDVKLGKFVRRFHSGIDRIKRRRKSSASINSTAVAPVGGSVYPDGLYYVSVNVGNPPRPYFLDMDTGSDLTWIQCDAPCTSCAKGPHPFYKPTKANIVALEDSLCSEVQKNQKRGYCESCEQCDYEIEYADHSSSMGVLARDKIALKFANGTWVPSSFVFGCAYDQQGQLLISPAKVDGVLGLSNAKVSLPSQLASQGVISNVVGHCISSSVNGGGYMFLGDAYIPRWGMTWVPMLNSPMNFYRTEAIKLSYGGQQLSLGRPSNNVGQVVFDSGSSYTYLTKEAYAGLIYSLERVPLERQIQEAFDQTLPVCWRANLPVRSVKDVKKFFKPLTFYFGRRWWIRSMTLLIPPEGYLIISNEGNVCLGILDGSEVHDGSINIIGDISMRGQLIVYDNVNQKIGWIESDCMKPWSSKSFSFF
ncbi:aspartyl protease APCB1 isoform X2 [Cinnamomum micranthum f. kanehirae]|uniref:Aspartyl protease APCB1 isoform X2 n=1 Tax=Cinnamomum micranthum f. kanehirae TaxID=337451 RepID=A0A443NM50_9MAGN|nr:aspartyl protease APCB1 isoform X2 [Cinnamomum micranthum f. kanehirae]